jgi:hypothetical protein
MHEPIALERIGWRFSNAASSCRESLLLEADFRSSKKQFEKAVAAFQGRR